jgi:hypothetical protein
MSETKDLSPEEMIELKELSNLYSKIVNELGEKSLEILELDWKKEELENEKKLLHSDYSLLKAKNEELTSRLIDKYGEGKINLDTGKIEMF